MISSSIFSVLLYTGGPDPVVLSAADLCADGFTFRLPVADPPLPEHPDRVVCSHRGLTVREEITLTDLTLSVESRDRCCILYRLIAGDAGTVRFMRSVMQDLTEYADLKNNGSDAALSAFYTDYPADRELDFPTDFRSWRRELLSSAVPDPGWEALADRPIPLRVAVSFPETQSRFLTDPFPVFLHCLLTDAGLSRHPLSRVQPAGVVLGSASCPDLFPSPDRLALLVRRCEEQSLNYSVLFPPVPEDCFDSFTGVADWLVSPGHPLPECAVVSDWGTARMLHTRFSGKIRIAAGPLLARGAKDPRRVFVNGEPEFSRLSSANSPSFRKLLEQTGITGILWESCFDPGILLPGDLLVLPFCRLTAATRCTLRSVCRFGSRGLQPEEDRCAYECEQVCFGYSRALNMIGRGNSLFCADPRFLTDSGLAADFLSAGPGMIILDLLA